MRVAMRTRLPDTRESATKRFMINRNPDGTNPLKVYVTVGLFPDGRPGELFIHADKAGELLHGILDAVALSISIGLQYGAPIRAFADKFKGMSFEPSGFTGDEEFPTARSVLDVIGRWLLARFGHLG